MPFRHTLRTLFGSLLLTTAAHADAPRVAVDIMPVHALVAQVMGDLGTPDLILPPNASPHGFSMRPSQARMLENADLVILVGEELTPWMEKPLSALAEETETLALLDQDATLKLDSRDLVVFANDHDDHDDHEDHDDHKDHDDHNKHEEHADHDDHDDHDKHEEDHADHEEHDDHEEHAEDDGHDDHHDHDHDGVDPHAWLDPENAKIWLGLIAEQLGKLDAENAATYRENASNAQATITSLQAELSATLAPVQTIPFLVYHDAFQYFDQRFDLDVHGAIAASDADSPSPARLAELREEVREHDIACIFSEPQYSSKLVTALQDGASVREAAIDPLGSALTPGPNAYGDMMRALAAGIADCLGATDS